MKKYSIYVVFAQILISSIFLSSANGFSCLENWYIGGSGSIAWHNDLRFFGSLRGEDSYGTRTFKKNWGGNFSIGYLIQGLECVDIRIEGEFIYRTHKLYKTRSKVCERRRCSSEDTLGNGRIKDAAVMGNLIADIPFPFASCLNFYFGLGVGASHNRISMKGNERHLVKPPFSRNSWLVAGQLLAGLSYQLSSCTVVTLGYRLFSTGEILSERSLAKSINRPYIQSVDLGLRFQL